VTFYVYLNAFSILSLDVLQQNIALLTNRIALFGSHDLIQLVYPTFLLTIFHLVCEKQQQQQNNDIAHFHIIFTFKEFLSYFSIRNFIQPILKYLTRKEKKNN
jgi:hypothetical protein